MLSLLLPLLRGHGSPHPARLLPLACVLVALGSLAGSLPGMALAADGVVAHAEDQLFTVRTLSQARTAAGGWEVAPGVVGARVRDYNFGIEPRACII